MRTTRNRSGQGRPSCGAGCKKIKSIKLKIAIDASNIRGGGGVTYLKNIVDSAVFKKTRFAKFHIIGHEILLNNFESTRNLNKIPLNIGGGGNEYKKRNIIKQFYYNLIKTKKILNRGKFDLVFHAGGAFYSLKIPQISYLRNILILRRPKGALSLIRLCKLKAIELLAKRAFGKMNVVICQSKTAENALKQHDPAIKTKVVYNGITGLPLKRAENDFTNKFELKILYYSLIAPYKNHITLFEAVGKLDKTDTQISIDLIGPFHSEYFKTLQKNYNKIFKAGKVNYLGMMPQEQVFKSLNQYRYAIFLSEYESFPNSLFEIVKAGLPVLALKCEVSCEFMPKNLIWVNCNEPTELRSKIQLMNSFDSRKLRQIHASQLRTLDKLSWETCAEKTIELIKRTALNEKRILSSQYN